MESASGASLTVRIGLVSVVIAIASGTALGWDWRPWNWNIGGDEKIRQPAPPGDFVGRVILAPGVAATRCTATVSGTNKFASCDSTGWFHLRNVSPGPSKIQVSVDEPRGIRPVEVPVFVNSGDVAIENEIVVAEPGAILGEILDASSADLSSLIFRIPDQELFSIPGQDGRFLMTGVAPGTRTLEMLEIGEGQTTIGERARAVRTWTIAIAPGAVSRIRVRASGIDLELQPPGLPDRPVRRDQVDRDRYPSDRREPDQRSPDRPIKRPRPAPTPEPR